MKKIVFGKIKIVAKTGGLKTDKDENQWLNPTDEYKEKVLQMKDEIIHKNCEIETNDEGKVIKISIIESEFDEMKLMNCVKAASKVLSTPSAETLAIYSKELYKKLWGDTKC